jgi:hypothetical protein
MKTLKSRSEIGGFEARRLERYGKWSMFGLVGGTD